MATVADTFVETTDINLSSHTPTGPNAGTSWDVSSAGGNISVNAANDDARDQGINGNRYRMTDDLGSDQMDVKADVTLLSGLSGLFPGVSGRVPNSGTGAGWEFVYDTGVGAWSLDDNSGNVATLSEAAPSGAKRYWLAIRTGEGKGYMDGVLKVTVNANSKSGNTRSGITLGNFSVSSVQTTLDNFEASSFVPLARRNTSLNQAVNRGATY